MSLASQLSDADVAAMLREMGQDIGPMNDATRCVYRRKLERLMLEQTVLSPDERMEPHPWGPPPQLRERGKDWTQPDNLPLSSAIRKGAEKVEVDCGTLQPKQTLEHKKDGTHLPGKVSFKATVRQGADGKLDCAVLPSQQLVGRDEDGKFSVNISFNAAGERKVENNWEVEDIPEGSLRLEEDDDLMDDKLISFYSSSEFDAKGKKLYAEEEEEENDLVLEDYSEGSLNGEGATNDASDLEHFYTAGRNLLAPGRGMEMDGDRYVLNGSFSTKAPLLTPASSSRNKGDDDDDGLSQLRQRTPFPPGRGAANDVGSYDRHPLKPSDYAVSPRDPLSTYLGRCTPPPSAASQCTRPAAHSQLKPPKQSGIWFWIVFAAIAAVGALGLLVLYNMEPGYTSPV